MIIVNIATCKRREPFLQMVIDSIKGVDQINVLANDYVPNVTGANVVQMIQDYGAKSKFFLQPNLKDCYYFTCDDDLIYHKDYFSYLTTRIEEKNRKCVVGIHGSIYKKWPVNSYKWGQQVIHLSAKISSDKFVSMLGTGTMAFHSRLFEGINIFDYIKANNQVDPYFMKLCAELKIPRLCVKRPKNYVQEIKGSQKNTIWQAAESNDLAQTELINKIGLNLTKILKC